jgi:hypothetical protein
VRSLLLKSKLGSISLKVSRGWGENLLSRHLHRILPPGGSGVGRQVDGDTIAWNCGLRRDVIFDDGGTQTEITAENAAGERAEAVRGEKKASGVKTHPSLERGSQMATAPFSRPPAMRPEGKEPDLQHVGYVVFAQSRLQKSAGARKVFAL